MLGLALAPTMAQAQGLPIDFDADAFEPPAAQVRAQPPVAERLVAAAPLRRAVRYGERTERPQVQHEVVPVSHDEEGRAGS